MCAIPIRSGWHRCWRRSRSSFWCACSRVPSPGRSPPINPYEILVSAGDPPQKSGLSGRDATRVTPAHPPQEASMVATDFESYVSVFDPDDPVFALHRGGKMAIESTVPLRDAADLAQSYTPGVARVCEAIAADPEVAHDLTWVSNTVAVVTDGTAV